MSGAQVEVTGDGSHFEAIVVSDHFAGSRASPLSKGNAWSWPPFDPRLRAASSMPCPSRLSPSVSGRS